ncbi:CocE/NonD family hydrolase [Alteribacillus iranensis]|uniref:Xaa-Pro dipeptidyl-peptidase C-terminal domain-containing protein n=1 Tax=Alteribacillus iranensis TaxID=930128 RepID=A0A1I2DN30_9BACI|nr:CocE/NonD family hydrolase [Alteribacillus iranensis]SFE81857.1 hypothetical protein SAMN05192532_104180 [Alteribacillus iranensis]
MTKANQIIVERDVPCKVRDGVTLYANIYRPQEEGKYPVLLSRLPYNKNLPRYSHYYIDPFRMALAGYVVIIQDVRGRFASEGEFNPLIQEIEDGYDVVEWAAHLPFTNGKVGMFGLSYYGVTQLYAALAHPPSLKAIFPAMTAGQLRHGLSSRLGVPELVFLETWFLESIAPDYLKRKLGSEYENVKKEIVKDLNNIDEWHKHLPIKEWPPIKKHPELEKLFHKYIDQDVKSELVTKTPHRSQGLWDIDVPAYHLAGWYDSHLGTTLMNYKEMKESQNNQPQKLIVGPWAHGNFDSIIGERFFGIHSEGSFIDEKDDITSLHIKWYDQWLKEEEPSDVDQDDPVKIFVMGVNKWRSEKEWPLKRTSYTSFYLHSNGNAGKDMESGTLNTTPPENEPADTFIYDPDNPVPTKGGGTLFFKGKNAGPMDQQEIEKREDVLVYTTPPLEKSVEVTGPIKMYLWVSTDAPDTDFTAKLVDVFPDGRSFNLTDGIVRMKTQNTRGSENDQKDKVRQVEIDLWATSNVFLPGHSIRVEVSSSNFPRFAVNPNTGETTMETSEVVKAVQTVYHDQDYPSFILLPIIPVE